MEKKKVIFFGGGLGTVSSIYHLTQTANWQEKYDITVYQLGWRLGGKGASGVNKNYGYRVEEHGLHFWFGFYENAFNMIKDVYKTLDRPPEMPLSNFEKAFKGAPYMYLQEHIDDQWINWKIDLPTLPGNPGDGKPINYEDYFENIIKFILGQFDNLLEEQGEKIFNNGCFSFLTFGKKNNKQPVFNSWLEKEFNKFENKIDNVIDQKFEKWIRFLFHLIQHAEDADKKKQAVELALSIKHWLWDLLGELVHENTLARRLWVSIDFVTTLFKGLIKDDVLNVERGKIIWNFDLINDWNYIDWLAHHGADIKYTVTSPFVRAMYDGPFSFLRGNVSNPNVEAGTILRVFLRLAFHSKKNVVWKMQAGMGDTIFGPCYEVFQKQGIKFEFFHAIRNVKLSADKKSVAEIEVGRQATLKPGYDGNYNPFVVVNDLPCWPSEPNYEQLVEGDELEREGIDLESSWSGWKDRETIRLKSGEDFDQAVLGLSLASIPHIAPEIVDAFDSWYNMVEEVQSVETQAFQLWLDADNERLGCEKDLFLTTYVEPVDTFSSMNQLLEREDWPNDHKPKYIAYFCGAKPSANYSMPYTVLNYPDKELQRVKDFAKDYMETNIAHIWPKGVTSNGHLDWSLLVDIKDRISIDRLEGQYFRSNIDPSERYVLSVKGSSKFRLRTDETSLDNLLITGDWIFNGYNVGSVEAATVAGILTARAISKENIPIFDEPENL